MSHDQISRAQRRARTRSRRPHAEHDWHRAGAGRGGADRKGYVKVDERRATTAAGVRAMGECAGSPQFTHVAFDDFRVVRANLTGGDRTTRNRLVPYCMFLDPELARVGCNETDTRRRGIGYRLLTLPMAASCGPGPCPSHAAS